MKQRKKILAVLLSCTMAFSVVPSSAIAAEPTAASAEPLAESTSENLALSAVMSSNGNETNTLTAAMANDGSLSTRWASTAGNHNVESCTDARWLCMEFDSVKTVASVAIEWERKNPTRYVIQSSTDGETWNNVKEFTEVPSSFREIINFDTPVEAKYIRVLINEYLTGAEKEDGTFVEWATVSVYEFEAYATPLVPELDLDSFEPVFNEETNCVEVPVPEGYTVQNNGADFEQIVADDFSVHRPLTDKSVKLALKFTNTSTGKVTLTKEHTVDIPGIYTDSTGNAKPQVIPEIAEWYSDSLESFRLSSEGSIVIDSEDLRYTGEEFQKDLEDQTGISLPVRVGDSSSVQPGDFFFSLESDDSMLGEEGYAMSVQDSVQTKAIDTAGAYWATRTILQTLKLSEDETSLPMGQMRDYPRFPVRSFVFDVGRKAVSMDMLKNVAKNMAWYKMNDFQVHLSDNYIFLEDYYNEDNPDPTDAYDAYGAFRLESSIENEAGETITSEDYHYSREEFRDFIQECRLFGVDIVPEIDVPAHAMAITEVFPEYAVNAWNPRNSKRSIVDHLNIEDPEVVDFTKTVFDDYTGDQTFDSDTIVHVGADEFEASPTAYRNFLNTLIPHVKQTNTTRLWGGLTWIKDNPLTEISKEAIEDVQINLWSSSWADGLEMYELGFDLINTLDTFGYMVPNGGGGRGAYGDYLNKNYIFTNFEPNRVGRKGGSFTTLPAGDRQILGGAFAIWQDNIDKQACGLSEEDLFIRFFDALPLYAEKTWANGKEKESVANIDALSEIISIAPNTNPYSLDSAKKGVYAEYDFDSSLTEDSSQNDRDLSNATNVSTASASGSQALKLNGGESFAQSPLTVIGSTGGTTLSFTLKLDEVVPGQILFEADSPYGTHDIRITENNKLGFTRELFDYEFDYELTPDVAMNISIVTEQQKTSLYVNGELASTAVGRFVHKDMVKKSGITNASFALPLQRIGSKTNAIKGTIDNISIAEGTDVKDYSLISSENFDISCDNENALVGNSEGPATLAFDGNTSTIWHSNYTPMQELPATITVDLGKEYALNKMSYLPRQGSSKNGDITEYTLQISTDGENYTTVSEGTWASNKTKKDILFEKTTVRYVKFTALSGEGGFASAAEITFHRPIDQDVLQDELNELSALNPKEYTPSSWARFDKVLDTAKALLEKEDTSQAEITEVLQRLSSLRKKLTLRADFTGLQALLEKCSNLNQADYTDVSWHTFLNALNNANDILNNPDASQEQVNTAKVSLENAFAGLEKKSQPTISADKKALQALYDSCSGLKEASYTAASWKVFANALAKVKIVLADTNATQDSVNQALTALQNAKNSLVALTAPGPEPSKPALPKKGSIHKEKTMNYKVTASTASKKTVTVTRVKKQNSRKIRIPSSVKINGYTYKVTAIGPKAFRKNRKLTSITLGANITTIGKESFMGCRNLRSITLNTNKLKKVYKNAFKNISSKAKIRVPKKKLQLYKRYLKKSGISKKIKIVKK